MSKLLPLILIMLTGCAPKPEVGTCFWYQNKRFLILKVGVHDVTSLNTKNPAETLTMNIKANYSELLKADCP